MARKRTTKQQQRKSESWEKSISRRGKYNPDRPRKKSKPRRKNMIKDELREGYKGKKNRVSRAGIKSGEKSIRGELKKRASVELTKIEPEFMLGGNIFNPASIRNSLQNDIKLMRREYSRLRPTAMKRLQRLKASDFSRSDTYQQYKDMFKKLGEMRDQDLPTALSELNRFLASSLSTITGQRNLMETRIETLREYGYDINESNFFLVMDIMEYLRDHYQGLIYDSDTQLDESIKIVNEIINDPRQSFKGKSVKELGDEVYKRYQVDRDELDKINELINQR